MFPPSFKAALFRFGIRLSFRMGGFFSFGMAVRRSGSPLYLMSLPRSGSSWIGSILASHPDLYYHFEPMNPDYNPLAKDRMAVRVPGRCEPSVARYVNGLEKGTLFSILSLLHQPPWRFFTARRILVKDVYSMFSHMILLEHRIECILLVRHPCQVAKSHIGRGILPPLHRLAENLEEVDAMRKLTENFRTGLRADENPWFQMGLYWEMAHQLVLSDGAECFRSIIRYEDVVEDPTRQFKKILTVLGLSCPDKIQKRILRTTTADKETYTRRNRTADSDPCGGLTEEEARDVMRGVRFLDGAAFERLYPNSTL